MFAKCVSRTILALLLTAALALLPAAGVLAAPTAPADGAASWFASLQIRVAEWTDTVLEALRLQPPGERPQEGPIVDAPRRDDDGSQRATGRASHLIDPDG